MLMQTINQVHRMTTKLLPSVAALLLGAQIAAAQTTAFTYQGRLDLNGSPANGIFDFQFQVFDSGTTGTGSSYGSPNPNAAAGVGVSNGLFTVALDFGAGVFTGSDRWLEVNVRSNGVGSYYKLSPRQKFTSAPQAVYSSVAATATTATTATSATSFTGNLAGNVTGPQGATVVASVGGQSAANVASGALAANAATSANVANAIVKRDAGGNFAAGTITAASETLNPALGSAGLTINGSRSGNFSTPVAFIQNTNATSSGPALRLLGTGNAGDGVLNVGNTGTGKLIALGNAGGEVANFDTNGNLSFGTQTRQMLNLWGSIYGIGVQAGTLYQRTDQNFAWHRQGTHSNNAADPGTGGTNLMLLDSSGELFVKGSLTLDNVNANNGTDLRPGLLFGNGTGEGLASQRGTNGPNRYGIDFYTSFTRRMSIRNDGRVGIGTANPEDALLDIEGDTRINDHDLYLRTGSDRGHGLGYRSTIGVIPVDGPFVYGWNGGALGTGSPDSAALTWDWHGNVWVNQNLSAGSLTSRGNADVNGVTRTLGGLVIEVRTSDPAAPAPGRIWLRSDL